MWKPNRFKDILTLSGTFLSRTVGELREAFEPAGPYETAESEFGSSEAEAFEDLSDASNERLAFALRSAAGPTGPGAWGRGRRRRERTFRTRYGAGGPS